MMMKSLKNIFVLACATCALWSCTKEAVDSAAALPDDMLSIQLATPESETSQQTRSTLDDESAIKNAHILFYNVYPRVLVQYISTADEGVTMTNGVVKFQKSKLDINKSYEVVVLTNLRQYDLLPITPGSELSNLDKAFSTLSDKLTLTDGLGMYGMSGWHDFRNNPSVTVSLTRQAVKFLVKLKFAKSFTDAYPNANMANYASQMQLFVNNLPDKSYLNHTPSPAEFNTLFTGGMKLKDFTYTGFYNNGGTTDLMMEAYGYENVVSGLTDNDRDRATNLTLKLPYLQRNADGTQQVVTENYYKLTIDKPTAGEARYATQRNTIYDMTVTVNGLGGSVPQIDGVDVVVKVKPWDDVTTDIITPDAYSIELSNSKCDIYGEASDNILVGTFMINRPVREQVSFTTVGPGFEGANSDLELLDPGPFTPDPYTPYSIRINVKKLGGFGYVVIHHGKTTVAIMIQTNFDNQTIYYSNYSKGISDVHWCTLSPNENYVHSEQKRTMSYAESIPVAYGPIWLHINKTTLRETKRVGTVMLAGTGGYWDTRVVLIQQPYLKPVGKTLEWATGNITLGHRPDGVPCYVIGGANDHGLWFRFLKQYGYVYENDSGVSWKPGVSEYYVPHKEGDKVWAEKGTLTDYSLIYDEEYFGDWRPESRPVDPCQFVYTGDPAIKWRTPIKTELEDLIKDASWIKTDVGRARGILCTNGIFLRCAGGRNGGRNQSATRWTESLGDGAYALYWSSNTQSTNQGFDGNRSYALKFKYTPNGVINDSSLKDYHLVMNTVNSVRCVRDVK